MKVISSYSFAHDFTKGLSWSFIRRRAAVDGSGEDFLRQCEVDCPGLQQRASSVSV